MKNWITFGDFTTNQKGFLIEQLDEVPMPEKKLNFIEVEGYSGYLTQIGVVYSGQSFSYKYNKEKENLPLNVGGLFLNFLPHPFACSLPKSFWHTIAM